MSDISTMPAGPELDRMVAEKVMGWEPWQTAAGLKYWMIDKYVKRSASIQAEENPPWHYPVFLPSTNIAHAWEVVERITMPQPIRPGQTLPPNTQFMGWWNRANLWAESGPDAAHRICRAALLAISGETP